MQPDPSLLGVAAMKRRIYLILMPIAAAPALLAGVVGSMDEGMVRAHWQTMIGAGAAVMASWLVLIVRSRTVTFIERVLLPALVVAYLGMLVIGVQAWESRGALGVTDAIRLGTWLLALAGFTFLAAPRRYSTLLVATLWTAYAGAVITGIVLRGVGGSVAIPAIVEVLAALLAAIVILRGLVELTRVTTQRATQLAELAGTDALTGLPNRRLGEERLQEEVERARRYRRPLSFATLDLDRFKAWNDELGHLVGDAALRALAEVLNGALREADTAVRWGGEEFVIILPEQDAEAAAAAAERVRVALERTAVPGAEGRTLTASVGVATLLAGETPRDALRRADVALYRAKRDGRNQVQVASATATEVSSLA